MGAPEAPTDAPGDATTSVHDRSELLASVSALLNARGLRMTRPRRAVLMALVARGGHVVAEEVVADVADATRGDPAVHRSSVYRTLEVLTSLGVLQHVHLGHGGTAYHLVEVAHAHAQCTVCGTVVDIAGDVLHDLDGLAPRVQAASGFQLDLLHVAFSGRCAACAAGNA